MSAQGIAARMVAKHGLDEAVIRVGLRRFKASVELDVCGASEFVYRSARLTLWYAVSTALGRMEASV